MEVSQYVDWRRGTTKMLIHVATQLYRWNSMTCFSILERVVFYVSSAVHLPLLIGSSILKVLISPGEVR